MVSKAPPVSGAEDRQVAALGAAAVWELVAARREIERLEREAKENDRTIASSHHAFSTLHRLCDEAHVPNHNGELVARVRELAERVGPCRDDEVMRLEESLIRLLERACPGAAWAGREAAEAAITQALDAERLEAGCGDSTSDRAQVAALGASTGARVLLVSTNAGPPGEFQRLVEAARIQADHPELRERARIVRLLLEESDRLWRRATDDGWNQAAALVASEFDALVERVERLT